MSRAANLININHYSVLSFQLNFQRILLFSDCLCYLIDPVLMKQELNQAYLG